MAIIDADGTPITFTVNSASPSENTLLEEAIEVTPQELRPERLIADKAYDDDPLDARVKQDFGIELISPNRRRRRRKTQDGRPLRRYKRRWKIERLFAWLSNFRRLNIRWEFHIDNFMGFLSLAFTVILLRRL